MTRLERLEKQRDAQQATLDAAQQKLDAKEAAYRAELDKALNKRRYQVGALVHEAGLFVWENSTLAVLFQLLATLRETPDPVGVLDSLLSDAPLSPTMTAAAAGASSSPPR